MLKITGFSLIEVLMSLLLISLILFGLDAAQLYSIQEAKTTYLFNTAMNQINNAEERLAALKTYEGLDEEITFWNSENQTALPSGFGNISGGFPNYQITIYWGDTSHDCTNQKIGASGCLRKIIQLA